MLVCISHELTSVKVTYNELFSKVKITYKRET